MIVVSALYVENLMFMSQHLWSSYSPQNIYFCVLEYDSISNILNTNNGKLCCMKGTVL